MSQKTRKTKSTGKEVAALAAKMHQRLGQFIDNVMQDEPNSVDLYYVEDAYLLERAHRYVQKYGGKL